MKITDEVVDKVAGLAKLEFKGNEKEAIKKDMERILTFMDLLNEVDTTDVEPLKYVTEGILDLRADVGVNEITKEDALKNAPDHNDQFFKVPKVINL